MKIGSTTKNFLRQLRQRSQTLDKAASEEAVDRVSTETERVSTQAEAGSEQGAEAGEPQQAGQARVSRWSEHVWSTFIHRGYSDDVTERQEQVAVDIFVDV